MGVTVTKDNGYVTIRDSRGNVARQIELPPPKRRSKEAFRALLTNDELIALYESASVYARIFRDEIALNKVFDGDDPRTIWLMDELTALGVFTPARRNQLLGE